MIWLFDKEEKIYSINENSTWILRQFSEKKKCRETVFCWYLNIYVKILYVYVLYTHIHALLKT